MVYTAQSAKNSYMELSYATRKRLLSEMVASYLMSNFIDAYYRHFQENKAALVSRLLADEFGVACGHLSEREEVAARL